MTGVLLELVAELVDELGNLVLVGWSEDDRGGQPVHHPAGACRESAGLSSVVAGKDAVVETGHQLAAPAKPRIIRTPQNELHGVAVSPHQVLVLGAHSRRPFSNENAPNFVDRNWDLLHANRGGNCLRLEIPAHSPLPAARKGRLPVQAAAPRIEFSAFVLESGPVEGKEHHANKLLIS
jgi:hypothetical protein